MHSRQCQQAQWQSPSTSWKWPQLAHLWTAVFRSSGLGGLPSVLYAPPFRTPLHIFSSNCIYFPQTKLKQTCHGISSTFSKQHSLLHPNPVLPSPPPPLADACTSFPVLTHSPSLPRELYHTHLLWFKGPSKAHALEAWSPA